MVTDVLTDLLKGLQRGSNAGRVQWQEIPDQEMFRAQIFPGMVRIEKLSERPNKAYTLWVMGPGGGILGELTASEGETLFPILEDVYKSARLEARGGNRILQQMLDQLS